MSTATFKASCAPHGAVWEGTEGAKACAEHFASVHKRRADRSRGAAATKPWPWTPPKATMTLTQVIERWHDPKRVGWSDYNLASFEADLDYHEPSDIRCLVYTEPPPPPPFEERDFREAA